MLDYMQLNAPLPRQTAGHNQVKPQICCILYQRLSNYEIYEQMNQTLRKLCYDVMVALKATQHFFCNYW